MASQGYVPGPAQIFTYTGTSAAAQFLGYSEAGVEPTFTAAYRDIVSDFGGPDIPVDVQFMGEQAYISMTINKYSEAVLQNLAKRRVGSSVTAGAIEANGLGSLMIAQGYAFQLLIYSPYNALSFQTSSAVQCFNFGAAYLDGDLTQPISVLLKRPRLVFRAIPVWNSTALTAVLYTTTPPSPVPSVN